MSEEKQKPRQSYTRYMILELEVQADNSSQATSALRRALQTIRSWYRVDLLGRVRVTKVMTVSTEQAKDIVFNEHWRH